jgi:hypothetical protein
MKKEEKSDLIAAALRAGITELTIREGAPLPMKEPIKIALSGILDAPGQFLIAKKHLYEKDNCSLIVDSTKGVLKFIINEVDPYGHFINGSLKEAEAIQEFCINKDKKFSLHELVKLIKKTKYYFPDKQEHASIIIALQNFSAKVTTDIQNKNDNRGNTKNSLERMSQTEAPAHFKLAIPIYEGYDKISFRVDVGLDPTDADIRFFLESEDLFVLLQTEKEKLISAQVGLFKEWGCAIVNV